jgi:hypothetical protein
MSQNQAPYVTADPIMTRYMDLSLAHEIPDMKDYAKKWMRLALDCDKESRIATAETCRKNARHYWEMEGGEYIRLIEECGAELIPLFAHGETYLILKSDIHVPAFAVEEQK